VIGLSRQQVIRLTLLLLTSVGLTATGLTVTPLPAAYALIRMDNESVEMALRYGMMNQNNGYTGLLGNNWIEGQEGALLNVYSPFMLLATRASKANFPVQPTEADIKKAKNKFASTISHYTDAAETQRIKFAVSFFGNDAYFAVKSTARLVGVAEGREVILKPSKEYRQPSLTVKPSEIIRGKFEAVNSYYFNFEDVVKFDHYELVVTPPDGQPLYFKLDNQQLY
jgi:hypothetical protein